MSLGRGNQRGKSKKSAIKDVDYFYMIIQMSEIWNGTWWYYRWGIGEKKATFGTYMSYICIWNSSDVSVRYDISNGFTKVRGGSTISKLS